MSNLRVEGKRHVMPALRVQGYAHNPMGEPMVDVVIAPNGKRKARVVRVPVSRIHGGESGASQSVRNTQRRPQTGAMNGTGF